MPETAQIIPQDRYNAELISNVHPADWINPEPAKRYNLVVLGAGTAGLVTAAGAAGLGAKVALVEKHLMGGDCLNVGCVPSKAVIRSARVYADVRDAGDYGVHVPKGVEVDFPAVMERMRGLRSSISAHDSARRFRDLGVDVFLGSGRFSGPDAIEVEGKTLRFARAVIATGARAADPGIPGLSEAGYLTNETVFNLTERPRRLAVLGSGPLGCELAQAFCRLGCEVTIIERGPQILSKEDADAARIVTAAMRKDGIACRLDTTVSRVSTSGTGKILHLKGQQGEDTLAIDEILVGVGRQPNVEGLDLEAAGVDYDPRKGVTVDDRLRTSNPRIFAAGDVCLKHKFTHTADATARIVIQNALFYGRKKLSSLIVPSSTYTDPEIAHVGMYPREAQQRGIEIDTITVTFDDVDRAVVDGEEQGLLKIHVRKGTDSIVGATMVARHAGEMISEITLAMVNRIGLGRISSVIHPYPTQAEAIRKAADAYNRTRLTPFVKKIFARWLAWTR